VRTSAFFTHFLLLVSCITFASSCYLLKQGGYIVKYDRDAVNIDKILDDPSLPSEEREFLLLVKEIKLYASERIGLRQDENYTRYVDMPRDYLADVVSACKRDAFQPYMWRYPVFGSFPYKGFFEREDALAEARKLKEMGYDVLVRKVDAFSTLGFFNDPVYSFMTDYSIFNIASLIIHEQTHTTFYIKDQIQFDEEMATFVGNEGALNFIRHKYGEASNVYRDTMAVLEDFKTFKEVILEIYDQLRIIYESGRSREEKLRAKEEIFDRSQRRFDEQYQQRFKTEKFLTFRDAKLNNAYIMLYVLYTQDLQIFYDLYEHFGYDLKKTVTALKALDGIKSDAKQYIREVLLKERAFLGENRSKRGRSF
jgi:predicted aminopeptidase